MKPFWALLLLGAAFLNTTSAAAADVSACTVSDKEFLQQITSAGDWMDVHAVFKRNFPACQDEGLYADGYTNLVVGVLAANWGDLGLLDELTEKDAAFKSFVLRHIGISAGEDDLRKVLRNAETSCPTQSGRLCKEIARLCKKALGVKP